MTLPGTRVVSFWTISPTRHNHHFDMNASGESKTSRTCVREVAELALILEAAERLRFESGQELVHFRQAGSGQLPG